MTPGQRNRRIRAVVTLDIGGTAIKGAVETEDGEVHYRVEVPTPVTWGVEAVCSTIVETIENLRSSVQSEASVLAVGLILPGVVDGAAGVARFAANIGWRDLPIRQIVSDRVGLPVAIDHDVRAAGLAEARLGAGRGVDDFLFVSIGTGIAAALFVGGYAIRGASGMAGEIGHLPVMGAGELCACGQYGCTETYASAAALARRYVTAGGTGPVRAEDVIGRAGAGDVVAQQVFDEALVALGRTLVCCVLIMDPSLIVLGGGMAGAGTRLTEPLSFRMQRGLAWRDAPPLATSELGHDAGRRGAALLAWGVVPGSGSG